MWMKECDPRTKNAISSYSDGLIGVFYVSMCALGLCYKMIHVCEMCCSSG